MKNKILLIVTIIICLCCLTACELGSNSKTPINSTVEPVKSNELTTNTKVTPNSGEEIAPKIKNEEQYTEIKVASAKDLFQNVKPYTRIILTEDYYNIAKIDPEYFRSDYAYLEDSFDGYEVFIHDVDHLEICSSKDALPEIVSESPHANVINFKNCKNVKLDGVIAGHAVQKGSCSGGVINLDNSSNIEILNCHLYGCGTYGLTTYDSNYITLTNSEIYECSYGLVDLYRSNHFEFNNCTFKDSEEFNMLGIHDCNNVKFQNCIIRGNNCGSYGSLIAAGGSRNIAFTKCLFENNTYNYFSSVDDDITLTSCKGKDENFENKYYPDYSGYDYEE